MQKFILAKLAGRLGNQMFEYAFARALSLQFGYPLMFSKGEEETRLDCFNLPSELKFDVNIDKMPIYHSIGYRFYEKWIKVKNNPELNYQNECSYAFLLNLLGVHICRDGYIAPKYYLLKNKSIYCLGYFQSERYFNVFKHQIKKDFTFNDKIKKKCKSLADDITNTTSVCVHIRLGDYLSLKQFKVCTAEYYQNAINYIKQNVRNPRFYIFTDSPELIDQYLFIEDFFVVPSDYNDCESMYLGSVCKHHIISNSSFSWWMQYLGSHKKQIVIAPSKWFNNKVPSSLYQDHWTIIDV